MCAATRDSRFEQMLTPSRQLALVTLDPTPFAAQLRDAEFTATFLKRDR